MSDADRPPREWRFYIADMIEFAEKQPDLFADFNGLPSDDARTEFYQHDVDRAAEPRADYGPQQDFAAIILEQFATAGVQQAHKEDRIAFDLSRPFDPPSRPHRRQGHQPPLRRGDEGVPGVSRATS